MVATLDRRMLKRRLRAALETHIGIPMLSWCAALVVRRRRPLVIGITGSVGKTTTKEIVAAVLMHPQAREVIGPADKAAGNMNNNVGLPLAVLGYTEWLVTGRQWLAQLLLLPVRTAFLATVAAYPKVLVLEYAAGWRGSVQRTSRIVPPDVAVVTEVGPAHLERFGTVDGVAREKAALVRAVKPSGLVVLNAGNPLVAAMASQTRARVVTVEGRGVALAQEIARVIARHLGIPERVVDEVIAKGPQVHRRLERVALGDITLIDDGFNANPLSMSLALDVLSQSAEKGQRRVAVLGTMAELGAGAAHYHREIGAYARERADLVIGVGEHADHYDPAQWFADSPACAAHIEALLQPGDVVLVKGSAAVQLHRVVRVLKHRPGVEPAVA